MSRVLTELGGQEGIDQVPGDARAHRAAAHTEDVHVIVLDALLRREVVVDEPGPGARDLVRADRRAHAAAAHGHASMDCPRGDGLGQRYDEVGIVVLGVESLRTEVGYVVPGRAKPGHEILLERESAVICRNSHSHAHPSTLCSGVEVAPARAAALWSARISARSLPTRPAGIDRSPARRRASISAFSAPVTSQTICRERLSTGYVNVIRRRPGWGPARATSVSETARTGSPGTSDAVWPSGPRPRRTRSSTGGDPATSPRSCAHDAQPAARSADCTGMAGTWGGGIGQ